MFKHTSKIKKILLRKKKKIKKSLINIIHKISLQKNNVYLIVKRLPKILKDLSNEEYILLHGYLSNLHCHKSLRRKKLFLLSYLKYLYITDLKKKKINRQYIKPNNKKAKQAFQEYLKNLENKKMTNTPTLQNNVILDKNSTKNTSTKSLKTITTQKNKKGLTEIKKKMHKLQTKFFTPHNQFLEDQKKPQKHNNYYYNRFFIQPLTKQKFKKNNKIFNKHFNLYYKKNL